MGRRDEDLHQRNSEPGQQQQQQQESSKQAKAC
jgi:hypothetical protein